MVKVGLFFLAEDAASVVSVLARREALQIEQVPTELKDYLSPSFPEAFREAFRRLREHYEPLAQRWQVSGQAFVSMVQQSVPTIEEMGRLTALLETLHQQGDAIDRQAKQLRERQVELEHFDEYVRALADLDIDIKALADLRFLHLRVGTVPLENLERLRESAALAEDLVLTLGTRRDRAHVLVVGAGGITLDLEGLLAKAHFEPFEPMSPLLSGNPEQIRRQLKSDKEAVQLALNELEEEDAQLRAGGWESLLTAGAVLARGAVFVECEEAMAGREAVAFLAGWVPRERLPELEEALAREVAGPVALAYEPPGRAAIPEGQPPSALSVPLMFRASAALVSLYGAPGYDELNPALVLAATTPVLFGMMFGDVGYGLLLVIAALAGRRRLRTWVAPLLSCGIGSTVFGFLYGSVFGVEHWLPALWLRPMDEPFRLLETALWVGVGFLLATFLLKAISLALQGRTREAIFGFQAGAGAVFYGGAVLALRSLHLEQAVPSLALGLIAGGLLLAVVHGIQQLRAHGRSKLTDLLSEFFHGSLTLLTNTLSFLRLAAFALAHSALSMALFMLVETIPPTAAGWPFRVGVFVGGSLLILVLDALAVGVQTIRLEFYEGLARYYRGDGQVYRPLRFPQATPP
ncbi:MAG: hypothetical protein HY000_03980 [Planctomycetes bacterium]|nr:hypothetical protein [Planctomycetota bacterium]